MDSFNEEIFLAKEWLIKVDAHTSTPYLIKFHSSPVDLTCCIMVSDTKRMWAEVLSSKQFARRWRECNKRADSLPLDDDEEEAWRTRSLEVLSNAHTFGGMSELSFEVVTSRFADFAFQLEHNTFKWRWETIFVGHKVSADILSKHFIMPLISVITSHSLPQMPSASSHPQLLASLLARLHESHVGQSTHVKSALSNPHLATTIRRITAVFNIPDPSNILTETDSSAVLPPREPTSKIEKSLERALTPKVADRRDTSVSSKRESATLSQRPRPINHAADLGSATEPEDDIWTRPAKPAKQSSTVGTDQWPDNCVRSPTPSRGEASSGARSRSTTKAPPSDGDSSPVRPIKKSKPRPPSSDEDSEEERKKLVAGIKRGTVSALGLRQPIKRGGKRF